MQTTLKSCPMCGGEAELKETHYLESEKPYSYVHCINRDCELHHHQVPHFSSSNESLNTEQAVDAWNQQAEHMANSDAS